MITLCLDSGQKKVKIPLNFFLVQIFDFNPWQPKIIGGKTMSASIAKSGEFFD